VPVKFCMLASSSAGNCAVLWHKHGAVLIDAGLGAAITRRRIHALDITLENVAGVLLTHVHGDHLHREMIEVMVRRNIPLYCPGNIAAIIGGRYDLFNAIRMPLIHPLTASGISIAGLTVTPFPVVHDAPGGCFGYCLTPEGKSAPTVVYATDIGKADEHLCSWFARAHLLVIESNHDLQMLENSGRPLWLKKRIRGRGHLSNDECAGLLRGTLSRPEANIHTILLAHLSQECNTEELALACNSEVLQNLPQSAIRLMAAHASVPTDVIEVKSR
jgi:phosphoribosyl 1,2-cyclic phosphodiesterase